MDNIQQIKEDYEHILQDDTKIDGEIEEQNRQIDHRIEVCDNTDILLARADENFSELTSIFNKKDLTFLAFSTMLQAGAKYLIKRFREMSDKEIADKNPFHSKEHSDRMNYRYYASTEEIVTNPVPFDAVRKTHTRKWYKQNGIENPNFSGLNHRTTALGHDPVLGLVFGTANIMTSTITRSDFLSWHVNTLEHEQLSKNGNINTVLLDTICERASTAKIFSSIIERIKIEKKEGWLTLGTALLKEIVHLSTDLPSKQSLPIPIISTFSPELAKKLSFYGLNTGTVVEGTLAIKIINWLIAFLHRLTMKPSEDEKFFQVRTQKILMYSDTIATVSDIGYSMIKAYLGDKNTMQKFDLGGYIITLSQICKTQGFIAAMNTKYKVDYIISEFNNY